jgi:hypothetical protein
MMWITEPEAGHDVISIISLSSHFQTGRRAPPRSDLMRTTLKLAAIVALVAASASAPAAERLVPTAIGPTFQSIGPLAFGPDGTLYAGDRQAAAIFALDLGAQAASASAGTKDVTGIDAQIASTLGTAATDISITDMVVHPRSRNTFIAVMRGQGPDAQPALLRIDGAGKVDLVKMDTVKFTSVTIPNPNQNRNNAITDIAFSNNRVWVAGLSNEQFASKLWSVAYPFTTADNGASVEIFHGNHNAIETRSPITSFVPYMVGNQPHIIGGYTCTPLVKFAIDTLKAGDKVRGTTIAELGNGNRPIDMVIYRKDGQEYLLMTNTTRGVMKIPTASFASAAPITERVAGTGGVPFETVASMTGIDQLDLLDATKVMVIVRAGTSRNLQTVILP